MANKAKIVKRQGNGMATSIGNCFELFDDCKAHFYNNVGKRPNYVFVHPDKSESNVLLSSSLVPAFESGKLDKATILELPVYVTEIKDDEGEPVKDDNGEPLVLMIAGKPGRGEGVDMSKIKREKVKKYEPITDNSFDEYF